jgi:hypothetical protein
VTLAIALAVVLLMGGLWLLWSERGARRRRAGAPPELPSPRAVDPDRFRGRVSGAPPVVRPPAPRVNGHFTGAPGRRFGGEVRMRPDAVGRACGQPVAQCARGRDCLCID